MTLVMASLHNFSLRLALQEESIVSVPAPPNFKSLSFHIKSSSYPITTTKHANARFTLGETTSKTHPNFTLAQEANISTGHRKSKLLLQKTNVTPDTEARRNSAFVKSYIPEYSYCKDTQKGFQLRFQSPGVLVVLSGNHWKLPPLWGPIYWLPFEKSTKEKPLRRLPESGQKKKTALRVNFGNSRKSKLSRRPPAPF